MNHRIVILGLAFLVFTSCNNKQAQTKTTRNEPTNNMIVAPIIDNAITVSTKHNPNVIFCDLDGDKLKDTVKMGQNKENKKYGLQFIFGNKKMEYLGLGKEVLGQDFDDLNWVGIFEKAPKGKVYFNNVNDECEIIGEEEVNENDKIKLQNDGIFIHADESCGGGVIYFKNGKFACIQQE